MDEQSVQLIRETRQPIKATQEHPQRVDYEYERNRTASIFMFAEPLSGFRQVTARSQRTKADWAQEVASLLATPITRSYVRRIEFVYTPKHGSWLSVAGVSVKKVGGKFLCYNRVWPKLPIFHFSGRVGDE